MSNHRFRKRFRELERDQGLTPRELALRLEWATTRPKGRFGVVSDGQIKPDITRVKRVLGLAPDPRHTYGHYRRTVSYEIAVRLADALDMTYQDAGV